MRFAYFEFEYKNDRTDKDNDIDAFAHARDGVFEVDLTVVVYEHALEDIDLFDPGSDLRLLDRPSVSAREFADYFVWRNV